MKKQIILMGLMMIFLLPLGTQAQFSKRITGNGNVITSTRQVGHFDRISVGGTFDVKIVEGTPGKIEIKAESNLMDYIVTDVSDGKLQIRWRKNTSVNTRKKTSLTVWVEELKELSCSGASDVVTNMTLQGRELYLRVSGAGDMKVKTEVSDLEIKISGAGDLDVSGTCKNLTATVSGSGDLNGYGLKCDKLEAKVTGSGDIDIRVEKELKARVSGSGDINYKGNPGRIDVEASGSGDVSPK